jgi:hypothetical protein
MKFSAEGKLRNAFIHSEIFRENNGYSKGGTSLSQDHRVI